MKLSDVSNAFAKVQRWQLIAGGIVVALSLGGTWWHLHDTAQQDIGAQQVRDSIAVVAVVALHHQRDDAKSRADSASRAARSFADSVTRASQSFARRQADLARHPLAVASIVGDAIRLGTDTTHYTVQHPVAQWITDASATVAKQDSAIRDASLIVSSIPTIREKYEAALRLKDSATASAVTSAYEDGKIAGKKLARAEPRPVSKSQTALRWVERIGIAVVAFKVGQVAR